jgi:hypothetical protein
MSGIPKRERVYRATSQGKPLKILPLLFLAGRGTIDLAIYGTEEVKNVA